MKCQLLLYHIKIQDDENEDTPSITVGESDEKDSLVKTITSWKFVDEENLSEGVLALPGVSMDQQADFETVVSMLPTQITAVIEGKEDSSTLGIPGWACPEFVLDEKLNYPVSGEFTFTAKLPEGYACEPLPNVKVLLGGAKLYDTAGAFTVTGGELSTDYSYSAGTLTINSSKALTISNTGTTTDKILVPSGVTANLTLSGVSIDVSGTSGACAFAVEADGTANITLFDTNTLTSGDYCAGLEVPEKANVTISGSGELNANGGGGGAGIGGGRGDAGGTIEISGGTVNSNGGYDGAGIGGGRGDAGGTIEISGGTVNANGGSYSAGIGGGNRGAGGTIEISGGTVNANGGSYGAGIGGGGDGGSGDITIKGSANVTATGGASEDHSLSGFTTQNGNILISENAVVKAIGNEGSGIGGGGGFGTADVGAGIGGGGGTDGTQHNVRVEITGGTVEATSTNGAGIGGGYNGDGGVIIISGSTTKVTATSTRGYDVGNGTGGNGGSLSVTDGATLEMKNLGTNVDKPDYKNCTIVDKDGNSIKYDENGKALPTLLLEASPANQVTYPNTVTLTATLSGADPDNIGKDINFTVDGKTTTVATDSSGKATYTPTDLSPGTYTFGASFAGDGDNNLASAEIKNYEIRLDTQAALTIHGLASAYTYGDTPFTLSTSGGSGSGAVSYKSSNPAVASVSGNTVTIHKSGTFTITATKAGDGNYKSTSVTSGTVTVREATPNLTLTATGGATTNHPITLTATVSRIGTGATPTGTVTFRDGNATLADVRLDASGKATYTVNRPTVGSHDYSVEYSGQSGYYKGSTATCTVDVGSADQTGFMIESPGAKTYGDGKFPLTTSGGQSTGEVSFSAPDGNGVLTVSGNGEVDIISVGSVKVTATKAGDSDYNQATATLDINVAPRDISNVIVTVNGNHVYTGNQIQPDFEVTDSMITITKDDYTHQYDTNMDAGKDAGAIILTGQRNYTGTKTVKFDIEPRPLTDAVITLESGPFTYTGKAIEPLVTSVEVDGIPVPAESYEVGYADNIKAGTATVTITAKADSNFSGTASTSFIIENVKNNSSGSTVVSGGGSSTRENDTSSDKEDTKSQTVPEPKRSYKAKGNKINQTISRADLRKLANSGKSLTLTSDKSSMIFKPAALKAILAAVPTSATNINFNATPADLEKFPEAAKLIGSRPVYDFAISYRSNNKAVPVKVNLPAGSVSIGVNYTPASTEITGNLFMIYVDDKGAVTWLNKSSYANGKVSAEVSHFSTYGVAYKTPETVFTDIGNHSAKKDIEWVAARDLFPNTEKDLFSPDSPITKGMLVTALGRLAGVNPDSYQSQSFTDVKADASYAPYAEWAVQKNIIKTTSENLFSPDEPITRENLAIIMANYAKQTGYSLLSPAAAVTFTDSDKISTWAKKEVTMMQRAGIMKGKDGSRFEPQSKSTRGEVSAILHRFVELMNESTMQG